jgi:hypothetical protein
MTVSVSFLFSCFSVAVRIWNAGRDPALVVKLLFAAIMKSPRRVHEQFDAPIPQNAGANGWIVIAAASSNIIPSTHEQFCHCPGAKIAWHNKVTNFVTMEIRYFARPIPLVPVSGD